MAKDKAIGTLLLIISVIVILVYIWLLWFTNEDIAFAVVKITVFLGILVLFGIIGWIGYTLATTPPPKPIEEIEKEIEEELKKIEKESSEKKEAGEGEKSGEEKQSQS